MSGLDTIANVEAEQYVIGSLFQEGPEGFSSASEIISDASFTVERYRLAFCAMQSVFARGEEINYGTVAIEVRKNGWSSRVGPVIDLVEGLPGLHNIESFCEKIAEAETGRKLWLAGKAVQEKAESRLPAAEIVAEADAEFVGAQSNHKNKRAVKPSEIIQRAGGMNKFMQPPLGTRIMTPWARMNRVTNGIGVGQVWIVGGIAGTGKTSLALNMAEHAVFEQRRRVKIVSKEMDGEELLFHMACTRARVDSQAVRANQVTSEDKARLNKACYELSDCDEMDDFLEIEDQECSTCASIAALVRKSAAEGRPVELLIIDYLQLLKGIGRFKDRREEVDQIAYSLKGIARTFRIPVLALAQLNTRKLENEGGSPKQKADNKRPLPPSLGDFRESAAIEQAADAAWILRRLDSEQQFKRFQLVDAFLLKQRGGRSGKIPFKFQSTYRLFEEIPESYHEDGVAA